MDNILNINCSKLIQEILVGSAYAQVKRSLLSDVVSLARYLPITTSKHDIPLEVKVMFLLMLSIYLLLIQVLTTVTIIQTFIYWVEIVWS